MRATVIRAPAGLGKTRAFAGRVARSGLLTEIYVPTHRLALEWRDSILQFNSGRRIRIISGRGVAYQPPAPTGRAKPILLSRATNQPATLCLKNKLADEVSKAGLAVYPNLCKQTGAKGASTVKCQHYDYCDYLAQFSAADVYIYTHAHLPLERGTLETWIPEEVIIDESFFQSMIQKPSVPMALLSHPGLPAAARGLCSDVAAALAAGTPLQARLASACKRGGGMANALNALKSSPPIGPADTEAQQRAAIRQAVSFEPIRKLLMQLAAEVRMHPVPGSAVYDASSGMITLHHRRPITRFNRTDGTQPGIFILDASASAQVIGRFFDIGRFQSVDAPRNAHVVQCHTTRCSTTSLVPSKNKNSKSAADAARRVVEINALISKLASGGKKVLVVGPVAIVGNPKTAAPSLIAVPPHCELAHFNAVRGVDHWKDFGIVMIVGRNEPPIAAIEDMARALYFDDPLPLNLTGKWGNQVRGYRIADAQQGVDTAAHADFRVQDIAEQLRESESVQAIDRLRLMHNPEKKTVIILSNLPLDTTVDETRTWEELMHGSRLERAWDMTGGVLPLNPEWLAANFSALWPTTMAAKLDVSRARKKGQLPNISTIRKLTLFGLKYKPKGQRQWSTCVADSHDLQQVQSALTSMIGQACVAKPA